MAAQKDVPNGILIYLDHVPHLSGICCAIIICTFDIMQKEEQTEHKIEPRTNFQASEKGKRSSMEEIKMEVPESLCRISITPASHPGGHGIKYRHGNQLP
jgi:hypothetical protein